MEKNKKNSKSIIKILIIGIIVIIALFLVLRFTTQKNITMKVDSSTAKFTYSSFEYKKTEENENEVKLESKEEKIVIKTYNNLDMKYDIFKEYNKMVYNGEEKQYKNINTLAFKNENTNSYVYIAQISDNSYLEISISNKENMNKTLDELANTKGLKKILDSVKITK